MLFRSPQEDGNSNFAPTFAIWDWLFGTFYMPEGRFPQEFGVDDHEFPTEGYLAQLIYPFKSKRPESVSVATEHAAGQSR